MEGRSVLEFRSGVEVWLFIGWGKRPLFPGILCLHNARIREIVCIGT